MTSNTQNLSDVCSGLTSISGALPDGEAHVWFAPFSTVQYRIAPLYNLLGGEELDRVRQFRVGAARDQFVISHALLRLGLARYLCVEARDLLFQTSENRKPEVAGGDDLKFNLSHTDGAAVLAITRHRAVGVDVERVRQNLEVLELAERFFARRARR